MHHLHVRILHVSLKCSLVDHYALRFVCTNYYLHMLSSLLSPLLPSLFSLPSSLPSPAQLGSMTPEQMQAWRWERELDERNRPLSDDELDALFPQEGYKVHCEWSTVYRVFSTLANFRMLSTCVKIRIAKYTIYNKTIYLVVQHVFTIKIIENLQCAS